MSKNTHYWILRNGQHCQNAGRVIASLQVTDKLLEVIVRPFVKDRTGAQNRLNWKWVTEISNQAGWDKGATHADLAERFLPLVEQRGPNGIRMVRTSTADLNVREFSDYLRNIEAFAAEWGIELTFPVDYSWIIGRKEAA